MFLILLGDWEKDERAEGIVKAMGNHKTPWAISTFSSSSQCYRSQPSFGSR